MTASRLSVFSLFLILTSSLAAHPEGMAVVSGEAKVIEGHFPAEMIIESGDKTILDWAQFSIQEAEHLHFAQAGSDAAILNRVTGRECSELLGRLSSNGRVFLINPMGIVVGPGASIETAGFIGSTFDVLNQDFLEDKELSFLGDSDKSIVNSGSIRCFKGDILLVARSLKNEGFLEALEGEVCLAAGYDVLFRPDGIQRIFIRTHSSNAEIEEGAALENSGDIQAAVAELRASANPYAKAISHTGTIKTISEKNGEVYLVAEKGTCEVNGAISAAKGEIGGTVHVLGDRVHLFESAAIDAAGSQGGGAILVGGDYQGKNSEIKNSSITWVAKGAQLRADALEKGNGGRVIVWGDQSTAFYGRIGIQGGAQGGDGGFAEVSGLFLDYQGYVDGSAPFGQSGSLLLDPSDIIINASATSGTFSSCVPPVSYNINTGVATNNLNATDLVNQLGTCNVTVSTVGAGGSGPNGGSITVSSALAWSTNNTLTLNAASRISIGAGITMTNGAALSATSNGTPAGNYVGLTVSSAISAASGNISLTGKGGTTSSANHGVAIYNSVTSTSGQITINGTGGTGSSGQNFGVRIGNGGAGVSVSAPIVDCTGTGGNSAGGNNIGIIITYASSSVNSLTASNSLTINGTGRGASSGNPGIVVEGQGRFIGTGSGTVSITAQGSLDAGGGNIVNTGMRVLDGGAISSGSGSITIIATAGNGTISNGFDIDNSNNSSVSSTGGSISITGNATGSNSGLSLQTGVTTTGGAISLIGSSLLGANITIDSSNNGGSVGADITLSGTVNGAQTLTLKAGSAGRVIFGGIVGGTTAPTTLTVSTASAIQIAANITATTFTISPASIPITLTGSSTITTTNALSIPGTINGNTAGTRSLTLNSGSSNTTLNGNVGNSFSLLNLTVSSPLVVGANISATTTGAQSFATINGGQTLTLNAGSSTITFNSAVGGTTRLTSLTATANGVGGITQNNTVSTTSGGVSYTSSDSINLKNNISTQGGAVLLSGPTVLSTADVSIDATNSAAAGANITTGSVSGARALTLNGGTGGVLELGGAIGTSGTPLTNLTLTGATTRVGGNIYISTAALSFSMPVVLIGSSIMNPADHAITFSSTLNGSQNLTLQAGSSTITFTGIVGGSTPIATLSATANGSGGITQNDTVATGSGGISYTSSDSLNIKNNMSTQGGAVSLSGPVVLSTANVIVDTTASASSGAPISLSSTVTISGATSRSLSLLGGSAGTVTMTGAITASGTLLSSLTATGSGVGGILQNSTVNTGSGGVSYTSTDSINLKNNITTQGGAVLLSGPTVLSTADVAINTTSSAPAGANITTGSVSGARALTLNGGTGGILELGGAVGTSGTPLTSLTLTGATTRVGGNIYISSAALTFPMPVVLIGSSIMNPANHPITFSNTLALGTNLLTLTPGSADLTFASAVSGSGDVVVTLANNVNVQSTLSSGSFTQNAGTGTTTFSNTVTTSAIGGLSLTGNQFTFANTVTAQNGGGIVINNSGALTLPSTAPVTVHSSKYFQQTGAGTSQLGADITLLSAPSLMGPLGDNNVVFSGPVVLTANVTVDTSDTDGDISFLDTVDSDGTARILTFDAGTGDITMEGAAGESSPLSQLQVPQCGSFASDAAITTNGDISLTGGAITLNGPIATEMGGDVEIMNTGVMTIGEAADMTLSGIFSQSSALGHVDIGGDITTSGGMSPSILFTSPLFLTGDVIFSTDNTDVHFQGSLAEINENYSLIIDAGSGAVEFDASVGGSTYLSSLQVTATGGIQVSANQTVASGPMYYTGPVTITTGLIFSNNGALPIRFQNSPIAIEGNYDLQVLANNSSVLVEGNIDLSGGSGEDGGDLAISGIAGVTINGVVSTIGGGAASGTAGQGGAVFLSSSNGSISIHTIDVSGGNGTASANGGRAGNIAIMPSSALGSQNIALGMLIINTDLGGNGNLVALGGSGVVAGFDGLVAISANRSDFPSTATITSSVAGNNAGIFCGNFIVGSYEAITILGNLTIQTSTAMTLGDTIALRNLFLVAGAGSGSINLRTHGSYNILSSEGFLYPSPTLHFYGGTGYFQFGTLNPAGPIETLNLSSLYTTNALKNLLIYSGSTILNFDVDIAPPEPLPPLPDSLRAIVLNELAIADAELTDRLPVLGSWVYHHPTICKAPKKNSKDQFESFHFENGVRTFNYQCPKK